MRDRLRDQHERHRSAREQQQREAHDRQRANAQERRREAEERQREQLEKRLARAEEREREREEQLRERQEQWQRAVEARFESARERLEAMRARLPAAAPARGAARARLIEEASALFLARGFADVSMQEIADAVGVTKAAMYYHFRSKEELFEAVAERAINDFWEGILSYARGDGSLREVLLRIIAYVRAAFETVSLSLIEDVGRHLSREAQLRILSEHPTPERELQSLFRRAIEAGEMRPLDVEGVAEMFLAMLMSLTHRGHTQRRPQPGDDALLLDVLLHGIAAG